MPIDLQVFVLVHHVARGFCYLVESDVFVEHVARLYLANCI